MELLFLLLPVAAVSGWWIGRRSPQRGHSVRLRLPTEYLKGLNYLLDEQQDKAIEVFIRMLEADSDTVDVHFALANLFLRRGEVDRAIRIHQNLIARPTLTREQRNRALFELGRDYMRAGLLDRAENLFLELTDDAEHGEVALQQLLGIYQQEKEWGQAVTIAEKLSRRSGRDWSSEIAQFRCELADEAVAQGDVAGALKRLKQALAGDRRCARASLLEGQLLLREGNAKGAIRALRRVEQQDPALLPEVLEPLQACYAAVGRPDEMTEYLSGVLERHGGISPMLALAEQLRRRNGEQAAISLITDSLRRRPSVRGMSRLIQLKMATDDSPARDDLQLLGEITHRILEDKPFYKCGRCGFTGNTLHWHCPSCQEWNTIKPIHGLEGE